MGAYGFEGWEVGAVVQSSPRRQIVMELCGAGSVGDLMKATDAPLEEEQISATLQATLKALSYLHSYKKIHRDVKAGNILLTNKGEAKLADFGVSTGYSTLTKRKTIIGTPFWMAPEVIQEAEHDSKADIWSLGITAIELAETVPPHSDVHPMRAIFMIPSRPPPILSTPDDWSEEFRDFIAACLVKDPSKRPSAEVLLNHPFVTKSKGQPVLQELVERSMELIASHREEMERYEDDDDDDDRGDTMVIGDGDTRNIPSQPNDDDDDDGGQYETVVISREEMESEMTRQKEKDEPDGTMRRTNSTKDRPNQPQYMQHLSRSQIEAERVPPTAELSVEDLRSQLESLDEQLEREIQTIRNLFRQRKKDLLQAVEAIAQLS
eukprot:TRINITY_DN6918_c0_g1_i2.p1 TRINITY_DN6918_c0_g1~~TRINITY_DN6918_c0_g1_i2.p1  ORF type:complete len:379 (-),score=80.67 TRINITY_DN6918_c0_g1_i2:42-1178(-)